MGAAGVGVVRRSPGLDWRDHAGYARGRCRMGISRAIRAVVVVLVVVLLLLGLLVVVVVMVVVWSARAD